MERQYGNEKMSGRQTTVEQECNNWQDCQTFYCGEA
jgi:hypothetical protein